jgi:hypothetical protein
MLRFSEVSSARRSVKYSSYFMTTAGSWPQPAVVIVNSSTPASLIVRILASPVMIWLLVHFLSILKQARLKR